MNTILQWLDHRTGYREVLNDALYERIPGGARWRYVFGSMLVFAFVTQVITGFFLWAFYSAGSQNAWESVYYIQYEVQGGWLLRGVHHFMAQAMIVLLPLHLLQVVLAGAYRAPREINFWLGLVLMLITLALGLTGYLLPWDQKGYWATKVATELSALPPGGSYIQKLVVGGEQYGQATLTRFFALHAGLLPALLVMVLALHIALFRRHGITTPENSERPDQDFWPHQVLLDGIACLVMMAVVLGIVVWKHGAELGPPAEPSETYGAARPEWYFLFLFQMLKKFHNEFIGAIVVPSAVMGFLFLMPFIGRVKFGHMVNVVVILVLIGGAAYLTGEALYHDNFAAWGPDEAPAGEEAAALFVERQEASKQYHESREAAHQDFERVKALIEYNGIPREGVQTLIANDPMIQGARIFKRACASCHSHADDQGHGIVASESSAPNLYGIGNEAWWKRLLSANEETGITSSHMFGDTVHVDGEMAAFVTEDLVELDEDQQKQLDNLIAMMVTQAGLPGRASVDAKIRADGRYQAGLEALEATWSSYACTDCHKFGDLGDAGSAPDLTNIYTEEWLAAFIANPSDERFYGDNNDRMPAFAPHADLSKNQLTPREIQMLSKWLRGDWDAKTPPAEEAE